MREPTREEWESWAAEIERPRLEAEKKATDEAVWQALCRLVQQPNYEDMIRQQILAAYQMQAMFCRPYFWVAFPACCVR